MNASDRRPERPWATGVLVVAGLISLSFNVRHSLHSTTLPKPLGLLYGAGPVALAAAQSHVVAVQAARGELVGGRRKAITFGLVIGALALSFLGMYDLLQHSVPNPFPKLDVNLPAVLTPIVVDLMAIAALNELLRTPASTVPSVTVPAKPLTSRATEPRTVPSPTRAAEPPSVGTVTANRATAAPEPSHRTEPTVPSVPPATVPAKPAAAPPAEPTTVGTVEPSQANRANQATTEPGSDGSVPPELRPGVKAPDYVIAKAREIYEANPKLSDRKLAAATRDYYGVHYAVIGRSACQTIIADYERGEETG